MTADHLGATTACESDIPMLKTVSLRGETITFRQAGVTGAPVLLIHSLGTSSVLWRSTLAALSSTQQVVAMDCRGHGGSSNRNGFTLEGIAGDALALMSRLGFQIFHLVGISMGGLIGATMWSMAPSRLRSLVLANSYATIGAAAPQRLSQLKAAVAATTMPAFAKSYLADTVLPSADKQVVGELEGAIGGMLTADYMQTLEAIIQGDVTESLRTVSCPTTVVVGDLDQRTPPEVARNLISLVPRSTLVILEGAGHLSVVDRPAEFNRTIMGALDRVT